MKREEGLVSASLLDGLGGAKEVSAEFVQRWQPDQGLLWLHMDYREASAQR